MKVKRISVYSEFQCTGAACQMTCCKGWKVPLDDAICEKYRSESRKGKLDLRFRFFVDANVAGPEFRSVFGRCPFWRRDCLCDVQKRYGETYMPKVCRQFPRQIYNFGAFCEKTLFLACPEAAKLFLTHTAQHRRFDFVEMEETFTYRLHTTNDDEAFLSYLLTAREQLVTMLRDGCRYDSMAILQYGLDAQNACLRGEDCPYPSEYKAADASYPEPSTHGEAGAPYPEASVHGDAVPRRLEPDCGVLNELFFNGFYHPYLGVQMPFLHKLCMKYIVELGIPYRVNRASADRKLTALLDDLRCKMPETEKLLGCYYEYYLQSRFLDIFEDYSFLRCLLYGMAKAWMLCVFIALYAKDRERVTDDEIAKIMAVFERRASHMRDALGRVLPDIIKLLEK